MKSALQKEIDTLRQTLLEADHPLLLREIMQLLKHPKADKQRLKRVLGKMVQNGEIVRVRGNRYGFSQKMDLVFGRFKGHREGYGFVLPDQPGEGDIYIGAKHLNDAMHGDRVGARIEGTQSGGRREGRIIRILERAHTQIVGRYEADGEFGFVIPSDKRIVHDLLVRPGQSEDVQQSDIVVAEIVSYPTKRRHPEGKILKVLGLPSSPEIDTEIVIHDSRLPHRFSKQALAAAEKIARPVSPDDIGKRVDLRGLPTVTIDGAQARDFDDAVSIEKMDAGFRLWVHIADVAHYVSESGPLDRDAFERGTSIYFPDKVLPMFPERLSTDICSLKPQEDRLSLTVEIDLDPLGNPRDHHIYESVIRSDERMTYADVWKMIEGSEPALRTRYARFVRAFEWMETLAKQLRRRRLGRGAIDFDLPEPQIVLGPAGDTIDIVQEARNDAHRIIEAFMLAANETVAQHLSGRDMPLLYRIHEAPAAERIEAFNALLLSSGLSQHRISSHPTSKALAEILTAVAGRPEENLINQILLRSMRQARYCEENKGHFGLASSAYAHFTSPIRRYPDLVVHRLLKQVLRSTLSEEEKSVWRDKLPEIARHTSERERIAVEAEREVVQRKQVKFMADKTGKSFQGLITGVTSYGLYVMIEPVFVEGMVHVSSLHDDYYLHDASRHALIGRHRKRAYRLGQPVEVMVARVDTENRQIDLELIQKMRRRRSAKK
ncbi:MAG: ribonuclease R [Nitrospiria bacterium]